MTLPTNNPVRSRIRKAAVWGLGNEITTANGYWNTVTRAYDPPRGYEDFDEFPCFNIAAEGEECENAFDPNKGQQSQRLKIGTTLLITAFISDNNDPALAQDKLLADVQRYFGNNFTIPDEDGVGLALSCYYLGSTPFGTGQAQPNVGIEINYQIWYRQFLTDPAKAG